MTENEAIERIRKQACNDRFLSIHCDDSCLYGAEKCEWAHAIQALEEIQQYRAIGTVEGYENAIKAYTETYILMKEYKSKLQDFEAIGTVEEFKALKEKSVAKRAVVRGVMGFESEETYYCPNCNERLYTEHFDIGYCNCGQGIKY